MTAMFTYFTWYVAGFLSAIMLLVGLNSRGE